MKRHSTTRFTLSSFARTLVMSTALLGLATAAGCDGNDDASSEIARQAEDAEVALSDVLEAIEVEVEDALVFDAQFEAGVDAGFYTVTVVEGDDAVTYEIDATDGRRSEVDRRRGDADRIARARRHRQLRRRLAGAVRDVRAERQGERPIRARLLWATEERPERGREDEADVRVELEIESIDRRGRTRRVRQALAND